MSVEPSTRERRAPHERPPGQGPRGARSSSSPSSAPGESREPETPRRARAHGLARLVHGRILHAPEARATSVDRDGDPAGLGEPKGGRERRSTRPSRTASSTSRATRARDTLVVSLHARTSPRTAPVGASRPALEPLLAAFTGGPRRPAAATTPPARGDALPGAGARSPRPAPRPPSPRSRVVSVTALAKKEGPRAPSPAEEARGTAWGRVLHQLLEAAMRTPGLALRPVAANLLREEELGPDLLDEVLRVAESVTSSPLWARARDREAPLRRGALRDDGPVEGPRRLGRARRDAPQGSDRPRLRRGRRLAHRGLEIRRRRRQPRRARRALRARRSRTIARRGKRSRSSGRWPGSTSWTTDIWNGWRRGRREREREVSLRE